MPKKKIKDKPNRMSGPTWGPKDWIPVRRGEVYCSPACGRPCTWKMYRAAWVLAQRTARALGKGWKPMVTENLGWHARAVSACGRMKVHANGLPKGNSYMAFLGRPDFPGGNWAEPGRTPRSAARNVVKKGRAQLAEISALLEGF